MREAKMIQDGEKQPTDMCVGRGGASFLPYHYHQKKLITNQHLFIYLSIKLFILGL